MKYNLYISKNTWKVLQNFGSIDYVVSLALKEAEKGNINITELPYTNHEKDIVKKQVTINSVYYTNLYALYGQRNPKISIARLLTYIVDNELYAYWGWQKEQKYDRAIMVDNAKEQIYTGLTTLLNYYPDSKVHLKEMYNYIKEL